ncbi:MAG TPA: hypothetical protein VGJ90_04175 [Methylophilaceae bacterium]|jgi:hypothetical protein
MTNRIPPSLNWLIDKRARLSGDIIKTKKALSKVQDLVDKLKTLESDLAAVDQSLKLHNIQVDVENIKPIRPQLKRLKLPHGYINNLVLTYLRSRNDDKPVPKSEIVNFVFNKQFEFDMELATHFQVSFSVRQSLGRLCLLGHIKRYHRLGTDDEGLWTLADHLKSTAQNQDN